MRFFRTAFTIFLLLSIAAGRQKAPPPQPPVRVTVLNVCTLSDADAKTMAAMLERIPLQPGFIANFEVARGITTIEGGRSRFVRARHEFAAGGAFATAQYTLSEDAAEGQSSQITEVLVFRLRDPKEIVQVSIESPALTGRPPQVLAAAPLAERIRLERAGAASVVLARCADQDQSARAGIFQSAGRVLAAYRTAFHASDELAPELSRPDMKAK